MDGQTLILLLSQWTDLKQSAVSGKGYDSMALRTNLLLFFLTLRHACLFFACFYLKNCPCRRDIGTFGSKSGLSHRNRDSWHVCLSGTVYRTLADNDISDVGGGLFSLTRSSEEGLTVLVYWITWKQCDTFMPTLIFTDGVDVFSFDVLKTKLFIIQNCHALTQFNIKDLDTNIISDMSSSPFATESKTSLEE